MSDEKPVSGVVIVTDEITPEQSQAIRDYHNKYLVTNTRFFHGILWLDYDAKDQPDAADNDSGGNDDHE